MDKIICRTCGKYDMQDFKELALHIVQNKKTHKKSMWAKRYLSKQKQLDRKLSMKNRSRMPFTTEDRIAKEDTRRKLSRKSKPVVTICPRCQSGQRLNIEVEHTDNPVAWRIKNCFVKLCASCGGE